MLCPACGKPRSICTDSRPTSENRIRRRRECGNCGYRWTTFEVLPDELGGTRDRARILLTLREVTEKINSIIDYLAASAELDP